MTRRLPDLIRFVGGPAGRSQFGWNGPWPPPETFRVAVGRLTGNVTVVADDLSPTLEHALVEAPTVDVATYRRVAFSKLPDDYESPHVVRAAEYHHEEEVTFDD